MTERVKFRDKERKWFDTLVCTGCHAIWKNRNAWCFDNPRRQKSAEGIASSILEDFTALRVVRRVGYGGTTIARE